MNISPHLLGMFVLTSALTAGCFPSDENDAGTGGSGGSGASSSAAGTSASGGSAGMTDTIPWRECKPEAAAPALTIEGTACNGDVVQYASPEGTRAQLSHVSFEPVDSLTTLTFSDTTDFTGSGSQRYLQEHDLVLYVRTAESLEFVEGTTSVALEGGTLQACGLGAILVPPGTTAEVTFAEIDEGADTISLVISGLTIGGSSSEFGAQSVTACEGGKLTATFMGEFGRIR